MVYVRHTVLKVRSELANYQVLPKLPSVTETSLNVLWLVGAPERESDNSLFT